jgi:membrane fusion protein (multidrug efflux system)
MASRSRRWRYALVILALLAIVAVIAGIKGCQIRRLIAFGRQAEQAGPPPEAVGTAIARRVTWRPTLTAVGTVAGHESVAIANVAAGRVEAIRFESGQTVRDGQVLVELDADLEKAQLRSAIARRDRAQLGVDRSRRLVEQRAIPQQELDDAETLLATSEAEASALRAQIENKVVQAPFAGKVGIRAVNLGQYLAPGTPVTTISAGGQVYVDFSLPQEQLSVVRIGTPVAFGSRGKPIAEGTVAAIDPTIAESTRTLQLRASVEKPGALRPGMFVNVTVMLPATREVVIVPLTAVMRAPYGDSIFVVEDQRIARQRFVRAGTIRGDFIEIVEGVRAGDEVVSEGAFKLRNGVPITIDNRVKPGASLTPTPNNR